LPESDCYPAIREEETPYRIFIWEKKDMRHKPGIDILFSPVFYRAGLFRTIQTRESAIDPPQATAGLSIDLPALPIIFPPPIKIFYTDQSLLIM
jgi:hypothetical protein